MTAAKVRRDARAAQAQAGMALMNMRQMYDQAVLEKNSLQQALNNRETLLAAMVIQFGKKATLVLKKASMENAQSGAWAGLDVTDSLKPVGIRFEVVEADEDEEDEDAVSEDA